MALQRCDSGVGSLSSVLPNESGRSIVRSCLASLTLLVALWRYFAVKIRPDSLAIAFLSDITEAATGRCDDNMVSVGKVDRVFREMYHRHRINQSKASVQKLLLSF